MFLEKLELQGFKTFAQKTTLEFLPPAGGKRGITSIVGPNGSGKSNLADAVRWVLGEQSLKLLRGKKSEDVIFSGTERRPRSGFAEVSLTLNNEDQAVSIEFTTVVLSRRLYRDGQSEYLINSRPVRLTDIQLLLAQANFGQRSYAVIGQGMVDHILVASPQERKEFFDEAAGVRQFQIKRNHAVNKLVTTRENLAQAEGLVHEIEPRLRSLSRQVRRLEDRGPIETEFKNLGRAYYGALWTELEQAIAKAKTHAESVEKRRMEKVNILDQLRQELESMEVAETKAAGLLELQREYEAVSKERNRVRESFLKLQNTIEISKLQTVKVGEVPIARVIHDLEGVVKQHASLLDGLDHIHKLEDLESFKIELRQVANTAATLFHALTEPTKSTQADPALLEEQKHLEQGVKQFDAQLTALQERIRNYAAAEQDKKGRFFAVQRKWETRQSELATIDREASDIKVELARLETQRDGLARDFEIQMQTPIIESLSGELPQLTMIRDEAFDRLRRLKTQLELIGSIDPEVICEHQETEERHNFLQTQIKDLKKAMIDLDTGIAELDRIIEERAETSFKTLNQEFEKYFRQLFDGGHASLTKTKAEEDEDDEENELTEKEIIETKKPEYTGIEIQATPPGKRVKSINMLSGGERALTSIALICAIMSSNPSPFVILDEVDAALDESNSIRFADIIDELSHRTQFIVITHNRATMHKANILYGVTIGEDGASRILSLKIEDVEGLHREEKMAV